MNRYLLAFGQERSPSSYTLSSIVADPTAQPPRIYQTMRTGGGIVYVPEAARELERRGYAVSLVNLTETEAAYLTRMSSQPRSAGEAAYLVTCAGTATQTADGAIYCTAPPGLSLVESKPPGQANPQSLEPALAFVTEAEIGSVRVYGEGPGEGGSRSDADQFITLYRRTEKFYRTMSAYSEAMSATPGWVLPLSLRNLLARDQVMLAEAAQPVEKLTGSSMGRSPGGRLIRPRFGIAGTVILHAVVVIVVVATIAAAVVYCASKLAEMARLWAANDAAKLEFCKTANATLHDPQATPVQKAAAVEVVRGCKELMRPSSPFGSIDWDKMVKGGVAVAGLLAVGSYFRSRPRGEEQ
jgi:hypothetical protein